MVMDLHWKRGWIMLLVALQLQTNYCYAVLTQEEKEQQQQQQCIAFLKG